jgi:hypothetical protein
LIVVFWLPFCCCQWQGAWAMVGGSESANVATACGGGCCEHGADRETPQDDERSTDPCAASCCVRGEATPPKWELPSGRALSIETPAGDATIPLREAGAGDSPVAPPIAEPPWTTPTPGRVRLQV